MAQTKKYLRSSLSLLVAMMTSNTAFAEAKHPKLVDEFNANAQSCFSAQGASDALTALENLKRLSSEAIDAGHNSAELLRMYKDDIKDCSRIAEAFRQQSSGLLLDDRAQRIMLEAFSACLELEKRDIVAARTNVFCHELFLMFKYR